MCIQVRSGCAPAGMHPFFIIGITIIHGCMAVDLLCLSVSPIFHVPMHACPLQDGVVAAAVFAEMAADLKVWGLTVRQQLESLREAYGFFEFRTGDLIFRAASFSLGRASLSPRAVLQAILWLTPLRSRLQCLPISERVDNMPRWGRLPSLSAGILHLHSLDSPTRAAGCGWHRSVFRTRPGHWNRHSSARWPAEGAPQPLRLDDHLHIGQWWNNHTESKWHGA